MSAPPQDAGRKAGGSLLPLPPGFAARVRVAENAAPAWYAAGVAGLGAFAALALVGVPAGAGLAVLGVALCGLGAWRGAASERGGAAYRAALWLLAAALAAMPAVRAAQWVWIPCLIAAAMLASLAAAGGRSGRQVLAALTLAVRSPLFGTVATVAPLGRVAGRAGGTQVRPALRGVAIAAALLAVFVPLFAAADAAFAELVDRALPTELSAEAPVGRVVALLAVVALGGALALARAEGPAATGAPGRPRLARLEWLLPLASLVGLFAAFVVVQLAVLFGGHDHVLRTAGLSYADYAHQGYGQLMTAAILTLAVIAGARRWARIGGPRDGVLLRALLVALCALCLVVLASALKRLGLYEEAYGATRLRLLADANILWLGAVLALVIATLASGRTGWLPRAVVLVSAVGAVAFAATNPDGRIAAQSLERHRAGADVDEAYLAELSADAAIPGLQALPCAAEVLRRRLHERDGLLGANLGRARARRTLAAASEPRCPYL